MGQAEFEEEAPSKQDHDHQDRIVDITKALHAGGGGGPFFIKVEEVSNPTPQQKQQQSQQQLRPKAPTPDSGVERSKWLRRPRRGFSLFNFKRKGHDDAEATTPREVNGQVAREGKDQHMLAQLHPQPGVLTDVEVQVLSQPHKQPFGALTDFEDGGTDPARLFQPAARAVEVPAVGSLVPLSPNINLVSDPATDAASLQLQEITTLYTLLNAREKGQGDFTSVSFELEELENKNVNDTSVLQMNENTDILQGNYTINNSNLSQPGTQERQVLPQILQPLTKNGGRPPTRDGKTLFVTSDRRPVQLVNGVNKEAIRVTKPELESWMSNLPPSLQRLPLNHIYIPGSHDSFSYTLSEGNGEIGPDAPQYVTSLSRVCPALVRPALLRWSVTQKATVTDQLTHGVRYFDIRVASRDSRFYFVHGLYGGDLQVLLSQIQRFLSSHPGEVVLLDFQHFHGLTATDHTALKALLRQTFTTTLAPIMHSPTLSYLTRYKYQVLVFYRNLGASSGVSWLWPSGFLPNPWPDTTSVPEMLRFLEDHLKQRNSDKFFVTQCVLTPSGGYVAARLFSSLKTMATKTNRVLPEWVNGLEDGPPGANIIMTDFVEQNNWILPSTIVSKNYQSLLT